MPHHEPCRELTLQLTEDQWRQASFVARMSKVTMPELMRSIVSRLFEGHVDSIAQLVGRRKASTAIGLAWQSEFMDLNVLKEHLAIADRELFDRVMLEQTEIARNELLEMIQKDEDDISGFARILE
jgi:hypothetical protein